jgi:hypothetical protein
MIHQDPIGMIIKTKVNPETVRDLNDEQLENLIYSKAVDLYLKTFGEGFKNTDKDILLCEVFSTFVVDSEINNGGFDQYFSNYAALVTFSISGLKKIGASKHADLLIRAADIYEKQKEEFTEKRNPNLAVYDDEYYKLEDFYPLRQDFIRNNIEHFLD